MRTTMQARVYWMIDLPPGSTDVTWREERDDDGNLKRHVVKVNETVISEIRPLDGDEEALARRDFQVARAAVGAIAKR